MALPVQFRVLHGTAAVYMQVERESASGQPRRRLRAKTAKPSTEASIMPSSSGAAESPSSMQVVIHVSGGAARSATFVSTMLPAISVPSGGRHMVDSCVGESLWGDSFLAYGIFDVP